MSHSENKPKTSQTSSTTVTNLNVQDTEGVTVVGDGNSVTTTDYGAIGAALDVGLEALRLGGDNLDRSLSFAGRSVDAIVDVNRGAFDFGRDALGANVDVSRNAIAEISDFGGLAIGEVSSANRVAVDAVLDAGAGVLDFARDIFSDSIRAQSDLTDANLTGLTSLARQTSESADDRVTRTAGYAFAAVAVVVIAVMWGKGS